VVDQLAQIGGLHLHQAARADRRLIAHCPDQPAQVERRANSDRVELRARVSAYRILAHTLGGDRT